MIKYFDCPLEASLMAKNFGVEVAIFSFGDDKYFNTSDPTQIIDGWWRSGQGKADINPDFLHIFEPRGFPLSKSSDTDFCLYTKKVDYSITLERCMYPFEAHEENKSIGEEGFQWKFKEIVRRNNQAFIAPKEKEEDA